MKAYILKAALWCEWCAAEFRRETARPPQVVELAPGEYDEATYDSDDWPKGPYPNGGGEADSPQHCDGCALFLQNPLTPDGAAYVREKAAPYEYPDGDGDVASWEEVAQRAEADGQPALAEWLRFYFADGQ